MNTQTTTTADRHEVIETLADLWARVGIRAMALPKVGRAGTVQAPKHAPVLADPSDGHSVDRTEAQDLHAWND